MSIFKEKWRWKLDRDFEELIKNPPETLQEFKDKYEGAYALDQTVVSYYLIKLLHAHQKEVK